MYNTLIVRVVGSSLRMHTTDLDTKECDFERKAFENGGSRPREGWNRVCMKQQNIDR